MVQRGYMKALSKSTKKGFVLTANLIRQFRTFIRIVLLVSSLAGFSIIGGLLFQLVESPPEEHTIKFILAERKKFLDSLHELFYAGKGIDEEKNDFKIQLNLYSEDYTAAIRNGTFFVNGKPNPLWTFEGSTYFCVTTFTQLGFGNLAPKSILGRFVSVLYACFSIPVGAIVFADLGNQLNKLITHAWSAAFNACKTIQDQAHEDLDKYDKFDQTVQRSKKLLQEFKTKKDPTKDKNLWKKFFDNVQGKVEDNENKPQGAAKRKTVGGGDKASNNAVVAKDKNTNANGGNDVIKDTGHNLRRRRMFGSFTQSPKHDVTKLTFERHHGLEPSSWKIVDNKNYWTHLSAKDSTSSFFKTYEALTKETMTRINHLQKGADASEERNDVYKMLIASPFCPLIVRLACFNNIVFDKIIKKRLMSRKRGMFKIDHVTSDVSMATTSKQRTIPWVRETSRGRGRKEDDEDGENEDYIDDDDDDDDDDEDDDDRCNKDGYSYIDGERKDREKTNENNSAKEKLEGGHRLSLGDISNLQGSDLENLDGASNNDVGADGAEPYTLVFINIILMIGYIVGGTFITLIFETWDYTDGAWFLIMSVFTVGYGDITPKDVVFFAYFVPYLILGIALVNNVIAMCMRFLTKVNQHVSNIGKDMYNTANARSEFHRIRRRGLRARIRWLLLRQHVLNGLPKGLVEESREHKRFLVQREKDEARDAWRVYFKMEYDSRLEKFKKTYAKSEHRHHRRMSETKIPAGVMPVGVIRRRGRMVTDASTMYEKPSTFCKRVKMRTRRKYQAIKNCLVLPVNYL